VSYTAQCLSCHDANGEAGAGLRLSGKTPSVGLLKAICLCCKSGALTIDQASDLVDFIVTFNIDTLNEKLVNCCRFIEVLLEAAYLLD
jgi:hypothetical protein